MENRTNEVIDLLNSINNQILNQIAEIFTPLGITIAQARIIKIIYQHDLMTIQKLTEILHLTYPNCSNICKRMEKSGLLVRVRMENDHRWVQLKLTEKSISLVDDVCKKLASIEPSCFKDIASEDYQKIVTGLRLLNTVLGKDEQACI